LYRIAKTLHRWHELECGTEHGLIERDESTGKVTLRQAYRVNGAWTETKRPYPDRETGALKRLGRIMSEYPELRSYVQGDPRGCALYILRPGEEYPHGIAL